MVHGMVRNEIGASAAGKWTKRAPVLMTGLCKVGREKNP